MNPRRPQVLWWGRFDAGYSRNAVIREAFQTLGWQVEEFRPRVSVLGHLEAAIRPPVPVDLVWVPCFRQRDMAAARHFATARGVPLVVDPLISAYDKQVSERGKYMPDSRRARRLLAWEGARVRAADRVVVDTDGHLEYFHTALGVAREALYVVPVGAEESLFRPQPIFDPGAGLEVMFYGSFLKLQGPDTIVEAACRLARGGVTVTLLGEGPEHASCKVLAAGDPRVRFEPWVDYASLPARIARAHILLGVFGATPKAARVIPNKVYQSLACARPVITRRADAYPAELLREPQPGLTLVAPGDAAALAHVLASRAQVFLDQPEALAAASRNARDIYDRWFSSQRVHAAMARVLASLHLPAGQEPA